MSKKSKAPSLGGRVGVRKVAKVVDYKPPTIKKKNQGLITEQGLDEGIILC